MFHSMEIPLRIITELLPMVIMTTGLRRTMFHMVLDFFLLAVTLNLGLRLTITRITITLLGMVPDFLLAVIMELHRTITRITITLLGMVPDFLLAATMNLGLRLTITRITITLHS